MHIFLKDNYYQELDILSKEIKKVKTTIFLEKILSETDTICDEKNNIISYRFKNKTMLKYHPNIDTVTFSEHNLCRKVKNLFGIDNISFQVILKQLLLKQFSIEVKKIRTSFFY